MSKYCPICNTKYKDSDKFCSQCEDENGMPVRLVPEHAAAQGMGLSLSGDANAISIDGGLNLHDSHNVSTVNTVTNNITNIAPQKSDIDILQEKKNFFLAECKRAYEDGILEPAEEVALEECRIKLGLDEATAHRILETVRLLADRNNRKTSLNPIAKTKLKILSDNLQNNNVAALREQIGNMEAIVNKYEHDELSRKYFLALAVLNPKKSIKLKESSQIDSYWKSYWSYLAYIKENETDKAEELLAGLDRFADYPEDNLTILATAGAVLAGKMDEAIEFLGAVTGDYTPELQRFVDSVYLVLDPETAKEMGADPFACSFYLVNMFGQKDPKVAAAEEAERKAREEAEIRAREEAERKAKEEAERKAREEAERKAREEAERKAREEAEIRAREEAERKAKEEAERKAKEEAERRAREEAERKAREEAKRKAKEEAERKARDAAERKAREENAECTIYIDSIGDMITAMMTARAALGWSSAEFRTKTASLPAAVSSIIGIKKAEDLVQRLNGGGFSARYVSSIDDEDTSDPDNSDNSDTTVCFAPRTEECSEAIDYAFGLNGKPLDFNKAFQSLKKAAEKNDPRALFDYGLCLGLVFEDEKNDPEQAIECFRKALDKVNLGAVLGDPEDMLMAARCALMGMIIESNNDWDFEEMKSYAKGFSEESAKDGNVYSKVILYIASLGTSNILDNEYVDNLLNDIKENIGSSPIHADALMLLFGLCNDGLTEGQKETAEKLAKEAAQKHLYSNDLFTINMVAGFVDDAGIPVKDEVLSYYINLNLD